MNINLKTDPGLAIDPGSVSVAQKLEEILSSGIDIHRCQAARALGKLKDRDTTQTLIAALLDEDEDVRTDAAEALREIVDPAAREQLMENLIGDPCTEVKLAAIDTLAALKDREVIPWLIRMVRSKDEGIVWDEQEFYASGWDDWVDIQAHSVRALGCIGASEAVGDIVNALNGENAQDLTENAFKALSKLGQPGVDALAGFLESDAARTRRRAAAALAAVDTESAMDALAVAFVDPASEVRLAALIGRAGVDRNDPRLFNCLDDPAASVRAKAVELIGDIYPDEVMALFSDPSDAVRVQVLQRLAKFPNTVVDESLADDLQDIVKSGPAKVSAAAADALMELVWDEALLPLLEVFESKETDSAIRLAVLNSISTIGGSDAIAALVRNIDDPERQLRLETMTALSHIASQEDQWPNESGTALLQALQGFYQPDEDTSEATVEAEEPTETDVVIDEDLAKENVDGETAFPSSTLDSMLEEAPEKLTEIVGLPDQGEALSDADMERLAIARSVLRKRKVTATPKVVLHEDIRRFAARVLGDIGQGDVALELSRVLSVDDKDLTMAATDSLTRILATCGDPDGEVFVNVTAKLETADRDLKLLLIRALGHLSQADAIEILESFLTNDDSFIRAEAVKSLSKQNHVCSIVRALIDDPDPATRLSVAQAIAKAGKPGAVDQLVDFAFSFEGYNGREAARLLRRLEQKAANHAFVSVLNDPDQNRIWSVAIESLEELNKPETE